MPPTEGQGLVSVDNGEVQFSEQGLQALMGTIDGTPESTEQEVKIPEVKESEPVPEEQKQEDKKPEKRKFTDLKVNGEQTSIEVDEAEEKELLQKGLHYTKEMQALRDKERGLAPYEGLINHLKSDPKLNQHIASYFQPVVEKPKEDVPKFDDPLEQFRWEVKQEVLAEVEQKYVKPMTRTQVITAAKAELMSDPMFREVHGEIVKYVNAQPPSISRTLALQLDQDPVAYMETFKAMKERLSAIKKQTDELPKPIKKEEKPPALESGGSEQPKPSDTKKRDKIDKAKARALSSGSTEALADFLIEGGFVEHLK